jgi:branched-chain amino acid transport system ATP-binding protein
MHSEIAVTLDARDMSTALPAERRADQPIHALAVSDVHVSFGGVNALAGVSLHVTQGEICSIIGPNGAGKTTLLNAISGVHPVQQGRIEIRGVDVTRQGMPARAHAGVGRTFQNLALFRKMSLIENVLVGCHPHMHSGIFGCALYWGGARAEERANRARAAAILRLLSLEPVQDAPADTLPYGLQKRVELARALAGEPAVLLLDEPMAGLTHDEKQELIGILRHLNQAQGMTLVLIEHDMGVVMSISDRIVVLDHGVELAQGTPAQIANDSAVIRAYLGEA